MSKEYNNEFEISEQQIDAIINENIVPMKKTISISKIQKVIEKKLSEPKYQKLYSRYQELNEKTVNEEISNEEIKEFNNILLELREYERSMFLKEFLIIY